ncbi:hypothetical protein ACKWTF_003999 [Chironomus riparius]
MDNIQLQKMMMTKTKIAQSQSFTKFIRINIKFGALLAIVIFGIIYIIFQPLSVDSDSDIALNVEISVAEQLKTIVNCDNKNFTIEIIQTDKFLILKNYIKASKYFECHESITYTTQGEFTFLENIIPVIKRWRAPMSVAVYSPGSDLMSAMNVIFYLRNCNAATDLVKEYVSFHIFFDRMEYNENNILTLYERLEVTLKCSHAAKFLKVHQNETYRIKNKLSYPINAARNIARTAATTYFVFACDIELYPNPNFVDQFFEMIIDDKDGKWMEEKNVFVFAVFEILTNETIPDIKQDLIKLVNEQKVFLFHSHICLECHMIPGVELWLNDTDYTSMKVITTAKRQGPFFHWEPFYVGTNNDPLFDDRITYERSSDKMSQAYTMCVMDYNFNVLSNAFLVHKNGVKTNRPTRQPGFKEGVNFLLNVALPEISSKYGEREGCRLS